MQRLKVVSVKRSYEQAFWNHVNRDPLDYYFFIQDLNQHFDQTEILMAMEENCVEGLMLFYAGRIVQLRGNRKAVELLLNHVNLEEVEMQAPLDCIDIVERKYKPSVKHELVLMSLKKGEEKPRITHNLVRLTADDAERVAEIMRDADPEWWGEVTVEGQRETLQTAFWLGIKQDNKIVSVGGTRFVDLACNISIIATDEHYRKMGCATSIVSALVKEILKKTPVALIHVLSTNAPALKVYSRVGFKPYKHYYVMRSESRLR